MIQNPTTADGYKSGLILNNPILELMGEGIWRADLTEINGALTDVEQLETRESTSTDITPLVELSSDEEMAQEEFDLDNFLSHMTATLAGAAAGVTAIQTYKLIRADNARMKDLRMQTPDVDTQQAARDFAQEAKINAGDYTNRKIEDIMAKHQVDMAQKPMMEDTAFDFLYFL